LILPLRVRAEVAEPRRLSSVSGLYAYLVARGDTPVQVNPVPRGLMTRRQGGSVRSRTAPLVRVPRTLPRILSPAEADRLVAAEAFAGDVADEAHDLLTSVLRQRGKLTTGGLDMEPFEVFREMIRSQEYPFLASNGHSDTRVLLCQISKRTKV